MSIMSSQSTRLELAIVGAALLVLLFCRQPPKSGNAGIVKDTGLMPQQAGRRLEDEGQRTKDGTISSPVPATGDLQTQDVRPPVVNPSLDGATSDNTTAELTVPPQPKMKRVGVVDARKCNGLNYKDLMYGQITVKWVWNGQKLVPHKVCEVKEDNGVTTVWSFDERDDIVLSEIQQEAGSEQ
jgi:hypothetical protein